MITLYRGQIRDQFADACPGTKMEELAHLGLKPEDMKRDVWLASQKCLVRSSHVASPSPPEHCLPGADSDLGGD